MDKEIIKTVAIGATICVVGTAVYDFLVKPMLQRSGNPSETPTPQPEQRNPVDGLEF